MWVSEPDVDVQALGEFGVAGQLTAADMDQTLAQERRQLLHLARKPLQRILGRAAVHPAQHDESRLVLHQRTHARAVEGALDEIALPMTRQLALGDRLGPIHDAQRLRHESGGRRRRAALTADLRRIV